MERPRSTIAATCLLALMPGASLWGQVPTGTDVRIRGRVVDNQSTTPIPGARVVISTAGGTRLTQLYTDGNGHFTYTAPEPGGYVFRAASIGYEETETPVLWTDDYRTFSVEIRLDPDAVLLAPIEVIARSRGRASPILENFEARLSTGLGTFFTREDVERIRPGRVTDLLARIPGVRLVSSGAGLRRQVFMSRGNCRAQIFVDGFLWSRTPDFTVDDAVSPASILGIEIYRGLSGVPAEFLTSEARCGVVAIWTRR